MAQVIDEAWPGSEFDRRAMAAVSVVPSLLLTAPLRSRLGPLEKSEPRA
jgi:hypothetical protein